MNPANGGAPCRAILVPCGERDDPRAARTAAALASLTFHAAFAAGPAEREVAQRLVSPATPLALDARLREVASALDAFAELAGAHQGDTILLALPVPVVQALLGFVTEAGIDNGRRFDVAAAGVTIVEAGADGRGALRALNAAAGAPAAGLEDEGTRVFLIRHGHAMSVDKGGPAFSHSPIPLSSRGREEAARVAGALRGANVDAIYSSDLVRARETAEFCARALGLEVRVDASLRELALGDFEGMTLDRVHAAHPQFVPWLEITFQDRFPTRAFHHPADLRFPNGQSVLDVHASALAGFRRLLQLERGRTIVLVSHGWVLQPLFCHIVGADPRSYYRFSLPTATLGAARVAPDGRGVLDLYNGGVALDALPKLTNLAGRPAPAREPHART